MMAFAILMLTLSAPLLMFTAETPEAQGLAMLITMCFTIPFIMACKGTYNNLNDPKERKKMEKNKKRMDDYNNKYGVIDFEEKKTKSKK